MPASKRTIRPVQTPAPPVKAVYTVAPSAADEAKIAGTLLFEVDPFQNAPTEPPPPIDKPAHSPAFRPLKVYAFDSSRGQAPGNVITVRVKYEKLKPGPVGQRIHVIDYDLSRDCFYDPVDLDDPLIAIQGGVQPSESDPHFHQQMVYAVASETLRRFEGALGRTIRNRTAIGTTPLRLSIYPHAIREPNAYCQGGKMVFGYFLAGEDATGRIVPGQTVFTCLSHDVIVHVTTHAILEAIRPDLLGDLPESDLPPPSDSSAFMEGFCDLCAMLLHYSRRDALLDTIQRTGGIIYRSVLRADGDMVSNVPQIRVELTADNPLIALAPSFGEALGRPGGLRSALVESDPGALERVWEPHARGQILLAAIFDAFFSIYMRRSQSLFRIYRSGGGRLDSADLPYPLAESLADEAHLVADRVFSTSVRALDYCPSASLRFGDYLRALITADYEYDSRDKWGVRDALMQAFRRRGIKPAGASFFTDAALRWPIIDPSLFKSQGPKFVGLPEPDASAQEQNQQALRTFIEENASAFSLRPKTHFDLYPLEVTRWTMPDDTPRSILCAQASQTTSSRKPASKKGMKKSTTVGVTFVFDGTGTLRHAICSTKAKQHIRN
jgi:hypothetical protein